MDIDIDSLISFIILWGTPSVMVAVTYFKMDKAERREAIEDFTSLHSLFTIDFLVMGGFLSSLGNLTSINTLKYIGVILLAVAGVTIGITMWNKSKLRSLITALLVAIAIFAWI
ncbi:hypothetical protein J0K78_04055 [Halobacillus sp. GSS1]|uniref:hypothetical protein n=1 Tax=Halobacillus sp. GSS1 TaxID=2815919 RepID=UPI001A8CB212|nr:hypothetical protein [Halobacillus sp. GSS1]MBN9653431.1 hypothetical protein [Halobacillus sp. GSS1]